MNPIFSQNILARANQMMQQMQNPQQIIQQFLPGVPAQIRHDPNQIINWLQQQGRITPQQIQMAQQMMGRR